MLLRSILEANIEANPFIKITFGLNSNATVFKKLIIGYSVGAILTKRDTIALVTLLS